jgi:diguanylate cyclase (GGDEF)-like protein/PAS domain S-box-containing protein
VRSPSHAGAVLPAGDRYLRAVLGCSNEVTLVVDEDLVIRYVSESVERVFGVSPAALLGQTVTETIGRHQTERVAEALGGCAHSDLGAPCGSSGQTVTVDLHGPGAQRWVELTVHDRRADPEVDGFVLTLRDVTHQTQLEAELRRKAFHDELTGLPNRALLMDRIGHALARSRRHAVHGIAVFFIDLDGFKEVNDRFGHAAGNALLVAFAHRVLGVVRDEDTLARIGGDEFALLTEDTDELGAITVADRIARALDEPFELAGTLVWAPASIGIARGSTGTSAEELLRDADTAMYRAKATGTNLVRLFDPAMRTA